MDASETLAAHCYAILAAPNCLQYRERQSAGEADFSVHDVGGAQLGVLEVASVVDSAEAETVAAILDERHGGERVPAVQAASDWYVMPRSGTKIRRLRAELDPLLAALNGTGIDSFHPHGPESRHPAVAALLQLGIKHGSSITTSKPGHHWIALPSNGCIQNPSAVNEAVREAASRPDNLRKLSGAADVQRHLFVHITPSAFEAFAPLALGDEVALAPDLPSYVNHAWAAAHFGEPRKAVVWHWRTGGEWNRTVVELPVNLW